LLGAALLEGVGAGLGVESFRLSTDGFHVRLVGNLPTAERSPSKLASFQSVRSGFGVKVHHHPVDFLGIGIVGDDTVTVTAFHYCHVHLLVVRATFTLFQEVIDIQ
jgi:hypothetical protein